MITGTGRSGTSFLVRFLGACGLDIGDSEWFARARAGHEHHLEPGAPYVVKDPWLAFYCDRLDMSQLAVDALILPVRDLMDAAESRIYQERRHLAENPAARFMVDADAHVPGGGIWPLEPLDQARVLATIQYRVVRWAATWGLPVFLLDFPRLVDDETYLIERLWPWLGTHCDLETAHAAFASTAKPEIVRFRGADESMTAEASVLARRALADELDVLRQELATAIRERDAARAERDEASAQRDGLTAQREDAIRKLRALESTRSWKLTRPLRGLRKVTRRRS